MISNCFDLEETVLLFFRALSAVDEFQDSGRGTEIGRHRKSYSQIANLVYLGWRIFSTYFQFVYRARILSLCKLLITKQKLIRHVSQYSLRSLSDTVITHGSPKVPKHIDSLEFIRTKSKKEWPIRWRLTAERDLIMVANLSTYLETPVIRKRSKPRIDKH